MKQKWKNKKTKRKREEAKRIKDAAKVKKIQLSKQLCKVWNHIIKTKLKLQCDDCKALFHKKCVLRTHMEHIPNDLDGDIFLCHMCYKEDSDSASCISSIRHEEDDEKSYERDSEKNEEEIECETEEVQRLDSGNENEMTKTKLIIVMKILMYCTTDISYTINKHKIIKISSIFLSNYCTSSNKYQNCPITVIFCKFWQKYLFKKPTLAIV